MEGILRKAKTPADLVRLCEEAGATTRPTSSGGTFVKGPTGTTSIPTHWATRGRGRANVIAAVRKLGLDFDSTLAPPPPSRPAAAAVPQQPADPAPTPVDPEEPDMGDTPRPGAARPNPLSVIPTRKPSATQEDLDACLELIDTLSSRIGVLAARIDKVEKSIAAGHTEPSKYDHARELRQRIITWFEQLPAGFRAASGTVVSNLDPDADKAMKSSCRVQLANLVRSGQLQVHGEGAGTQYSLQTDRAAHPAAS